MDEQYAVGLPSSLAFEYALIAVVSKHYAGLEPNVDKGLPLVFVSSG
jgi:hypothetical protein